MNLPEVTGWAEFSASEISGHFASLLEDVIKDVLSVKDMRIAELERRLETAERDRDMADAALSLAKRKEAA